MPEVLRAYKADPFSYEEARAVASELEVSEPLAITLVRRGYRTPEQARGFLEGEESHAPSEFDSMATIVDRVLAVARDGGLITVHGDFDADGVCATTVMVAALRDLGARCDWLIPDRMSDGYGLSASNVERLAARGTSLILTVDCGVASVDEVRMARELGMEVIVTDHHQPKDELPDCPILHPSISGYPFAELCGTAVAWKLSRALFEAVGKEVPAERDLDLVALATVADLVPLLGENRTLVRHGIEVARRAQRVGMRALAEAAYCSLDQLDEGDLAMRLGPRINAAGRLYRADAGVELLLTEDEGRATEIAEELNRANRQRQTTERKASGEAEAAYRALPEQLREAPAAVLAGKGWHPGVIGIVASRFVERHYKPTVVISIDEEGNARGSGRSIPGFDLLAALEACAEHLLSFGGHRGAAGLTLSAEKIDAFREAFAAHGEAVLGEEDLRRTERIDAMVGGASLGLDLAEELGRLAPFGMGNPGVRLLVPSATVRNVQPMGKGKHSRFSLHSGSHRAMGVAFGKPALGVEDDEALDAAVRLEVNQWNGSVEPRVVLRELYPLAGAVEEADPVAHLCECGEGEWWQRFEAELVYELERRPAPLGPSAWRMEREVVRGAGSAAAAVAELLSSGAGVLAVCADASRRAALAMGSTGLARFNGGTAQVACGRCGGSSVEALAKRAGGGLALSDYAALEAAPSLAAEFSHVVLVDPPASAREERLAANGFGYLHPVWSEAERGFALSVLGERYPQRGAIKAQYEALREAGGVGGEELRRALQGSGAQPLGPEVAARCLRVLAELKLVRGEPRSGTGSVGVVSSKGTDLERSTAFRAYGARYEEGQRYLERPQQP